MAGGDGEGVLRVTHESGAVATVHLFGATITSYKNAEGKECLFTSSKAVFDGSKAIRGGIPIVFPQFGPGTLPNHGFARTSTWEVVEHTEGKGEAKLRLQATDATRELWKNDFVLDLDIAVAASSLTTTLSVTNSGSGAFMFQALQHTYHAISSIEALRVRGLAGSYVDKLREMGSFAEEVPVGGLVIGQEVDRIYADVKERLPADGVEIESAGEDGSLVCRVQMHATRQAGADADPTPRELDCVLWNPWIEKAARLGDLGDEDYKKFVCVEPGRVSRWEPLAPKHTFALKQILQWTKKDEK